MCFMWPQDNVMCGSKLLCWNWPNDYVMCGLKLLWCKWPNVNGCVDIPTICLNLLWFVLNYVPLLYEMMFMWSVFIIPLWIMCQFIISVLVIHQFHPSIQTIKFWGQHFLVSFIHYFITAYITTHPKTTHTTQAMNMFIFNISFSSLCSNSFLCLSPSGLPTEASSSTTSA